jgi:hypothetical protein
MGLGLSSGVRTVPGNWQAQTDCCADLDGYINWIIYCRVSYVVPGEALCPLPPRDNHGKKKFPDSCLRSRSISGVTVEVLNGDGKIRCACGQIEVMR